ncbi:putative ribonuclease H-like domain-containing protein, partial [Tanacetum coccineum]
VIRCDNETEFKNRVMNQFYEMKDIKKEFSVARNPQQNGVAERKNRILIEAARTMLADSKLPTTFWAEVVNTDCYVQNSQKSQENSKKQANTDTGIRRVQKEAKETKLEPEKSSLGQIKGYLSSLLIKGHVINGRSIRGVCFCAKTFTKEAQMHPKENDTLAILKCPQFDQTAYNNSSSNDWKMNGRD